MRYPGTDHVYVLCDVCGRKVRRKDTQRITDKWNLQHGLIVCKWDVDNVNEQNKPHRIKETIISQPKMMRSEPSDGYATPGTDDRTPGAPRQLRATASTLGSSVDLNWLGPIDVGTSQITGYKIERSELVSNGYNGFEYGAFAVLTADSGSGNTYYNDTTATVSSSYAYRVSAINGAGTGTVSDLAYYPTGASEVVLDYLLTSQSSSILTTSTAVPIIL